MVALADQYLIILEVTEHLLHQQVQEVELMLILALEDRLLEVITLQDLAVDHHLQDLTAQEAVDHMLQAQDLADHLQEVTDQAHHLEVQDLLLLQEVLQGLHLEVQTDKILSIKYLIRRLNENLIAFFIFNHE